MKNGEKQTQFTSNPETPDTAKATLSIPFRSISKPFDAQVSVYFKDGTVHNTPLREVKLLKGTKCIYIGNFYAVGSKINYDEEWIDGDTINVTF